MKQLKKQKDLVNTTIISTKCLKIKLILMKINLCKFLITYNNYKKRRFKKKIKEKL